MFLLYVCSPGACNQTKQDFIAIDHICTIIKVRILWELVVCSRRCTFLARFLKCLTSAVGAVLLGTAGNCGKNVILKIQQTLSHCLLNGYEKI